MVIKMKCVSSVHGGNAVRYAMDKDERNKEKIVDVLRIHGIPDDIFEVTSSDVWDSMKIDINHSRHSISDAVFRIEICPAAEECENWSREDWQQCLDDAIRHLNGSAFKGKDGKILAAPTELDNCKWVAALHTDTDHTHIHLVACRITDDDRVQDSYRCETRALQAADSMAAERGWTRAQDKDCARKNRIMRDAIKVLIAMPRFDLDDYFSRMEARGWTVRPVTDSRGIYRGYSIGETTRHKDGSPSGEVMYQSSKLGGGRHLMVSRLEETWNRIHQEREREQQRRAARQQPPVQAQQPVPERPMVDYEHNGRRVSVPGYISDIIRDNITLPDERDYYGEEEEPRIPSAGEVTALAAHMLVEAMAQLYLGGHGGGSGGGGGVTGRLPWGKDKREEELQAARAARLASESMTPAHTRRRGRGR